MLETFCKILKKSIECTTVSNLSPLIQASICLNDQNVESCLIHHDVHILGTRAFILPVAIIRNNNKLGLINIRSHLYILCYYRIIGLNALQT